MARRNYLIETAEFVGNQMNMENYPQVVRDLTPYLPAPPLAHFDEEGEITRLTQGDSNTPLIALGQHYSLEKEGYAIHGSAAEMLATYEAKHGAVAGKNVEEKLGNIVHSSFKRHVQNLTSLDALLAPLEEDEATWSITQFPWGMAKKDLLQRSLRGFSDVDWYNFNSYFARVLRDMALMFLRDGHSYAELVPGNGAASERLWGEKLEAMAAGFQHFIEQEDAASPMNGYENYEPERVKEALAIFVELFEHLWD